MNYRREIDGLRAIAVLAVILFHAGLGVKGGFVGVDIFFVISGYLITSIILSECEAGTFTLAGFYERRVRRILPALFFVLLCCLPVAYILLLPDQMARFAKSFLSGLFFVSNYYFRANMGYFSPNSDEEPLLHLWSLAVEEQYYIFFPLLAAWLWHKKEWNFRVATLVWRHRSLGLVIIVLLISIASFIYAEHELGSEKLFYDTRGRVWELLIGSLLAIYMRGRLWYNPALQHSRNRLLAEFGSALGLLLILVSCFGLSKGKPFPGHWALFPTLGTALVILFASQATLTGRLLSSRILVGVGLISYSAYLWHWSLFAFTRITVSEPSRGLFAGLSVLSLGLAFISWRYVERPFRNRKLFQRSQIFRFAAISATLLVAVSCVGLNGIPSRFTADADLFVPDQERWQYVNGHYSQLKGIDPFSNKQKLRVLLLGDSFSQDLVNMMTEASLLPDAEMRIRAISVECQIYIGEEKWMDFVEETYHTPCAQYVYTENFYPSLQPLIQNADIIIFASAWQEWAARRLPETIKNLQIPDSTRVIVIGTKNFGKIRIRDYIGLSVQEKAELQNSVNDYLTSMNKILRHNLEGMPNVEFVDLHELACGKDSETCPIFSPEGKLLSYDGFHLTQAGAAYIGGLLKEHPAFKALKDTLSITDSR